ncbi:MAG: hypothetical protein QW569_04630 [Candidatus Bathyarchaeia archaeon]|nr:hypothetical protein [Candidatus Bathyarchaeota archaeon]
MKNDEDFEKDLNKAIGKLEGRLNKKEIVKLNSLRDKLLEMHRKDLVKINHSVMELICAGFLISNGYEVDLEVPLGDVLTCDLYARKGDGILIVEVETGFVPPSHALDPATYSRARIASKIARYSRFSSKFAIGVPPYYVLQLLPTFLKPPRDRNLSEILEVKKLCDIYYGKPPITHEEIRNARLHTIYIIDVDEGFTREVDPETYWEVVADWSYTLTLGSAEKTLRDLPKINEEY